MNTTQQINEDFVFCFLLQSVILKLSGSSVANHENLRDQAKIFVSSKDGWVKISYFHKLTVSRELKGLLTTKINFFVQIDFARPFSANVCFKLADFVNFTRVT